MNTVILRGNLGQTPVLRHTESGKAVLNFSIAVDRSRRAGETQIRETNWFDCTCWGAQAEHNAKYLTKGSDVIITGELNDRRWKDREGNTRRSVEIMTTRIEWIKLATVDDIVTTSPDDVSI